MANSPSINGANGRDARGRFVKGNAGGPGNPHIQKVAKLKAVMLEAVTQKDLRAIVKVLIEKARAGDVTAAREVMDRCFGKPSQSVELEADATLRAQGPAGLDKPFEEMSDLEIAEILAAGHVEVPPILKATARRVYEAKGLPVPAAFADAVLPAEEPTQP
ncbi:MAG: hypothetical protein WD151_15545 [Phycisphaeraceae bacterium]